MLALFKGNVDDSLAQFLGQVDGTDAIRYWDEAISGTWARSPRLPSGDDYTLEYLSTGILKGYTLLTVGTMVAIPEPGSLALAGLGLPGCCRGPAAMRTGFLPRRRGAGNQRGELRAVGWDKLRAVPARKGSPSYRLSSVGTHVHDAPRR